MAEALRAGAGGIPGLAGLLREHGEAIEWDLAHYWPGRSLMELYRGEMSWRELSVFIRYLPPDSATARALHRRSPEEEFWTPERHLAAATVDGVNFGNALAAYIASDPKKRGRFKAPPPIERPGVKRSKGRSIRFGGRHGSGAKELSQVFGGAAAHQ